MHRVVGDVGEAVRGGCLNLDLPDLGIYRIEMMAEEGIPHFANKAMMWKWLDTRLKTGRPLHIFYGHDGSRGMVNVLDGVSEAVLEGEFGWASQAPYRADILLRRDDAPPTAIEVTHTSPPSFDKLQEAARLGIDVYEVEGGYPPFSDKGLKVLKAHIAPRNQNAHRQFTQRMIDLYASVANSSTIDDGFIRVVKQWRGSLEQHDVARREELTEHWKEFASLRSEIRQGHVYCLRCKKANELIDGGTGFSHSSTPVHRPNGGCGYVHLCGQCEFEIRGGWDGVPAEDANEWWHRDDCPKCQEAIQSHEDEWERRFAPGPVGYVVDGRTVSREHFLGLLVLIDLTAVMACEYLEATGANSRDVKEFRYCITSSVSEMNEAVRSGANDPSDRAFQPIGLFGGSMPPCPLTAMVPQANPQCAQDEVGDS